MTPTATPTRQKAVPLPFARLLSRVEVAAYLCISPNTFDKMQADGLMPRPKRIYGRVLWDLRLIDAAIDALPGDADSAQVNPWD